MNKRTHTCSDKPRNRGIYDVTIGFDVTREMRQRLRDEAKKRGVSLSILGRAAINRILGEKP